MTDEKLDQLLKKALAPEVTEDEIRVAERKGTNKMVRRFKKISTGVAAAVGILALGTGTIATINPALAAKIPLIGNIFSQTQDNVTFSGDYSEKMTVLTDDQPETNVISAEDNGFTITASEIYCDGLSLYLTLAIESTEADFTYITEYITGAGDGETRSASGMYLDYYWQKGDGDISPMTANTLEGVAVDAHTFTGILKIDMTEQLTEHDKINIEFTKIGYDDARPEYQNQTTVGATYSYQGSWKLSIPVSADTSESKTFTFDESNGNVSLNTVYITPYEVIVDAQQLYDGVAGQGNVVVYDQNGEKLQYANGSGNPTYSYFAVQGKEISTLQVYVFDNDEDWFAVYKGGTIDDAKERAVISEIIDVE